MFLVLVHPAFMPPTRDACCQDFKSTMMFMLNHGGVGGGAVDPIMHMHRRWIHRHMEWEKRRRSSS